MAQLASARREGSRHRVLVWAARVAGGIVLALAVSLVLGRLIPVPSTLMLGRWLTGKEAIRYWKPLEAISQNLVLAVIAAEDQRFCAHWGVDFGALRDVLDDPDGPSRGASTITMQVAKNVYLWPGRSYLRKALEIPLALILDLAWGKPRVLEVYLNIAEWGDGVFGAEAAARRHFGKSARDLSPTEAARMVAALPNPLRRAARQSSSASRRIRGRMENVAPLATCVRIRSG